MSDDGRKRYGLTLDPAVVARFDVLAGPRNRSRGVEVLMIDFMENEIDLKE